MEKLKGDFENLSIAIADLPVGLIPFPDRCALLNSVLSLPSQLSMKWCIPTISRLQRKDWPAQTSSAPKACVHWDIN